MSSERRYALIGHNHNAITDAEIAAGLTTADLDLNYEPGNVLRYGAVGDGASSDATAFQNAADANHPVIVPAGTYLIDAEITLTDGFDWWFEEGAVVKNGLSESSGTTVSLFSATGSASSITTINGAIARDSTNVVTLTSAASASVGGILGFDDTVNSVEQFYAIVDSISGSAVTLDRLASTDLPNGGNVLGVTPITGRFIGCEFDFNGTTASPRYGYGITLTYHYRCHIANIKAKNVGSKVILINRGMDTTIENVNCGDATDPSTAGNGYVIRISNGNDNYVSNASGQGCRHIVDCTAASRNKIVHCKGNESVGTDFLTHFNGCMGNVFDSCDAYGGAQPAYGATGQSGDEDNVFQNGTVVNQQLFREANVYTGSDYKGNRVVNCTVILNDGATRAVTHSCDLYNCHFICDGNNVFNDGLGGVVARIHGGSMKQIGASKSLSQVSNASTDLRLYGTYIESVDGYKVFEGQTNNPKFYFFNCIFNNVGITSSNNYALLWNSFIGEFHNCVGVGSGYRTAYSTDTSCTVKWRNCCFPEYTELAHRDASGNVITGDIDRNTLLQTARGNQNITLDDTETVTGTVNLNAELRTSYLNSSGGAVTATLPDGIYDGQRKTIMMSDATTSSTVSVTSHETSDPEVFTFAATTNELILEWSAANAYWWTVKNIGATV